VHELRRRLFYVSVSVAAFGGIAYAFEQHIVAILLRPAHDQPFIYTSVGGGIDFLFRVCIYVGIAASIPVIIFQILRYVQPMMKDANMRFITWGSIVSGLFALAGVLYGYFWGLPAALHFLLHQFVTQQIRPLVTIQSYMSFVTVYMLGSSLLFQVPLIMIFINRIRPLKPQRLFHYERWVILIAFVGSGLMNPSPNLLAQLLLAGPIILMYQVGIGIVWFTNQRHMHKRPVAVQSLLERDAEARAARMNNFTARRQALPRPAQPSRRIQPGVVTAAPVKSTTTPSSAVAAPTRPSMPVPAVRRRSYVDGFTARQHTYRPVLRPQSSAGE